MGIIQEDMPGKSLEDLPEELAEELLEEHVTLEVRLLRAQMALPRISEPYCIPQDNFDRVVNVDTILAELQRCGVTLAETELHEKTVEIFKYARKLFAALVCEGFGECILDFLEEGLCDEDMPFVRLELGGWDHRSRGAPFPILESRRYKGKALKCVATGKWTRYHLANFSSQQWWVLAPEEQEKARAEERQRWEE
ncbi:uncharacterized protein LY89DRAFT_142003 [Mollisia scopiformis]|uniref:Uncharacterized protein n=1 Tax=Mollisia scopiformis TaxID=149040 RepID=A0A194X2W8_MOLSC|nr:uncharacterized protein LY89DRAFT_142003 [Mollisia scopiformis]KUJ14526.1 hypothetical protein LY89DRAFT_142003 [Mollisia scopiformis]